MVPPYIASRGGSIHVSAKPLPTTGYKLDLLRGLTRDLPEPIAA